VPPREFCHARPVDFLEPGLALAAAPMMFWNYGPRSEGVRSAAREHRAIVLRRVDRHGMPCRAGAGGPGMPERGSLHSPAFFSCTWRTPKARPLPRWPRPSTDRPGHGPSQRGRVHITGDRRPACAGCGRRNTFPGGSATCRPGSAAPACRGPAGLERVTPPPTGPLSRRRVAVRCPRPPTLSPSSAGTARAWRSRFAAELIPAGWRRAARSPTG